MFQSVHKGIKQTCKFANILQSGCGNFKRYNTIHSQSLFETNLALYLPCNLLSFSNSLQETWDYRATRSIKINDTHNNGLLVTLFYFTSLLYINILK